MKAALITEEQIRVITHVLNAVFEVDESWGANVRALNIIKSLKVQEPVGWFQNWLGTYSKVGSEYHSDPDVVPLYAGEQA